MLIVFDKDNTLIEPESEETFVQGPKDQKLMSGVGEKLEEVKSLKHPIVIASNQGGVEAGHKTLIDAIKEMGYALKLTGLDFAYFCPDFKGEICYFVKRYKGGYDSCKVDTYRVREPLNFRKPGSGMIQCALNTHCPNETEIVLIGDREEDRGAAQNGGALYIDAKVWREFKGSFNELVSIAREKFNK